MFKATGKTTVFDGFLKAYEEGGRDGEADDGANEKMSSLKGGGGRDFVEMNCCRGLR